jgi:hypothetical protein
VASSSEHNEVSVIDQSVELKVVIRMLPCEADSEYVRLANVGRGVVPINDAAVNPSTERLTMAVWSPDRKSSGAAELAHVAVGGNFYVSGLAHLDNDGMVRAGRGLGEPKRAIESGMVPFGNCFANVVSEFSDTVVCGVGAPLALRANDEDVIGNGESRNGGNANQKHLLKHFYLSNVTKVRLGPRDR